MHRMIFCHAYRRQTPRNAVMFGPAGVSYVYFVCRDQPLWLEHRTSAFQHGLEQQPSAIIQTTRIGLSQGKDFPWRWYLANCPSVKSIFWAKFTG